MTPAGAPEVLRPDWSAPVGALASTRAGGVSQGPWASLNLGDAVGDAPAAVAENRARFQALLGGARPVWLRQVHGTQVRRLTAADLDPDPDAHDDNDDDNDDNDEGERPTPTADAAWTDEPGLACVVQVADCLPVLFAAPDGRAVAAAHAGWRGLAAGVLDATVASLCEGAGVEPASLHAWLGPCIGPAAFEVGADVQAAFAADASHLAWQPRPDGSPRWRADLPALARARLKRLGVVRVGGGHWCTVSKASRFFSYRRDGVCGRLGAAVWRLR
jgi:YfiH family protein